MKIFIKTKVLPVLRNPLTAAVLTGLAVGTVFALNLRDTSPVVKDNNKTDIFVVKKINQLQSQLVSIDASIEKVVKKPQPAIDFSSIENKIKALTKDIADFKKFTPEAINQHFEQKLGETQKILTSQLISITNTVNQMESDKNPIRYIAVKNLPFSVISIDSIQQIPVASIQYKFKTIPLEKGEVIAGWKIVALDFAHQQIEFENKKKEHILLKTENIG